MYYAHRTEEKNKQQWQRLQEHLEGVAARSEQFANVFGAGEWGRAVGLFHDLGKYSDKFQRRLNGSPVQVDHATAGAQALIEYWGSKVGMIPAYIIAGHHSGLPDGGTEAGSDSCLVRRLSKSIEDYQNAYQEITPPGRPQRMPLAPGLHPGMQLSLFTRMLYSCLVDADSLDTERYCNKEQSELRSMPIDIDAMLERYNDHMGKFSVPKSDIERYRNELLHECLQAVEGPQGMYTLNMPTGSGKTLASLGFALHHAKRYGLSRIIYVIPYTSIIEQNAAIFRSILGSEAVLEHHSNIQREINTDEENDPVRTLNQKMQLAEENWDAPVIVTTNVQFFESLFSNKRSKSRKLHHIANSVVIFDEAQMMNGHFFKPSLYAMEELARNYRVTALFCTGTQPEIAQLFPESVQIREVVHDVPLRYQQFQRTRIHQLEQQSITGLTSLLQEHRQVLCIVNTRKTARELYQQLRSDVMDDESHIFHLSARMYAKHRMEVLASIRERLDAGLRCCVISTQLIEAGVDIDLPVVYRELAGLDSIAQAAGRCNRNGQLPMGEVYVFELEQGLPPGWFRLTGSVTQSILEQYQERGLSMEAVKAYFTELYFYQTSTTIDRTDKENILGRLNEHAREMKFPFKEVNQLFKLIDTDMETVIVPRDEDARKDLDELKTALYLRQSLRKLQPYTVQLYREEFLAYVKAGEVEEIRQGVFVLTNVSNWYKDDLGLIPFSDEHHKLENLII
ncbi:CRISPR-associated helicase Cas3' [Paenibacillus profundus]|uniref:CRISPR-associated helicase Cas3 n=1 Tax=Paenibacillus profundus TaxID=1173085 RepID=A0ABS8YQR8_9BACL|nr:CRISPR-associated helicase Cas3' [Paenibacillus profundus]MCE5173519.1 CRISPR-associated helicase Cas3' [Paenibacillus profundus]